MHTIITRCLFSGLILAAPLPALAEVDSIVLGMGCFWGAEKRMAAVPGVIDVESGYAGGDAERAGYRDVLSLEQAIQLGRTDARNHAEVVRVTFDTDQVSLEAVLIAFWQNHDPTQVDRQGNDVGSNYRSAIYTNSPAQRAVAIDTRDTYQQALTAAGYGPITTEIAPLRNYNRAERYHQDYLVKNPNGYCGLGGTDVAYPGQPERARPEALKRGRPEPGAPAHRLRGGGLPLLQALPSRGAGPLVVRGAGGGYLCHRAAAGLEAGEGTVRNADHGPVRGRPGGLTLHRL
jgi:peptide methionine sulfoxide reductase msrA/msrB